MTNKKQENKSKATNLGIVFGTSLGIIFGIIFNEFTLCFIIGISAGLTIGSMYDLRDKKNDYKEVTKN
ncbi:hypothetical protein SAMN02745163_00695 [Clostridium cavendishii DSM 21758]|uniref:Uncharacterized protein n=1 Tax=Clostridium cavendishii DSM 21758 TaxID=1121302 RepID=A0A1M6DD11_9CLOT|nr:hypothetical protein [Clostridium cavendishii]SHI71174.1 hypothetical protein SAMN02745163_00695 [Clostridium cavendishii DSM 21758]